MDLPPSSPAGIQSSLVTSSPWGAIWCGAIVAAAVSFVLLSFGSALGLAVASPSSTWRDTSAILSVLSGLWLLLASLAGFGLGGYLSGRLRTPRTDESTDETEFRDGACGLAAWALAIIIGAVLTFAAARALTSNSSSMSSPAATTSTAEPLIALELDQLFRSDRKLPDAGDAEIRSQAARIVASGLGHEGMAADDRAYLVRMVEQRTGLAPPQAEARVSAIVAKSQEALTRARHAAVILAFMIGASLLIGAAIAWVAATGGGQHRGESGMPHFWRRWDVNRVFLIR
jgi:hypothetical protein